MNNIKYIIASIALTLISISLALQMEAAVEVAEIEIYTGPEQKTYTIPAGKILILEHVVVADTWEGTTTEASAIHINWGAGGAASGTTLTYQLGLNTLYRPLLLSGATISVEQVDESPVYLSIWLLGKLVDENELYASINFSLEDLTITEGEKITANLSLARGGAVRTRGYSSSDLINWNRDPALTLRPLAGSKRIAIERPMPADEAEPLFLSFTNVVANPSLPIRDFPVGSNGALNHAVSNTQARHR